MWNKPQGGGGFIHSVIAAACHCVASGLKRERGERLNETTFAATLIPFHNIHVLAFIVGYDNT